MSNDIRDTAAYHEIIERLDNLAMDIVDREGEIADLQNENVGLKMRIEILEETAQGLIRIGRGSLRR